MSRSSLLLTVDRLNPSFLGPYGGTAAATPNFNRLAVQSLLLENAIVDAADLNVVLRSYWTGLHAVVPSNQISWPCLPQQLASKSIATLLVSDEPAAFAHPLAEAFAECVQLQPFAATTNATNVEETQIVQSLTAALETLSTQSTPFHLHLHLQGLAAPWDAPLELRAALRGDDDPPPRLDVAVPALHLPQDYDPDLLCGITQAYAAQVMLVDMALGVLLEAIESHVARDELLLIVTSPRGFPLGEHLVVGDAETSLYGELLQVPLFVRRGDHAGALARLHTLVQPADIAATIVDWHGLPQLASKQQASSLLALTDWRHDPWPRRQTLSVAPGQRATRTTAWFLRQSASPMTAGMGEHQVSSVELFSKPDDRFEVNEISSLCPSIAEGLAQSIPVYEQALINSDFSQLGPLSPELSGVEDR